jgi:hypothetical protein
MNERRSKRVIERQYVLKQINLVSQTRYAVEVPNAPATIKTTQE